MCLQSMFVFISHSVSKVIHCETDSRILSGTAQRAGLPSWTCRRITNYFLLSLVAPLSVALECRCCCSLSCCCFCFCAHYFLDIDVCWLAQSTCARHVQACACCSQQCNQMVLAAVGCLLLPAVGGCCCHCHCTGRDPFGLCMQQDTFTHAAASLCLLLRDGVNANHRPNLLKGA